MYVVADASGKIVAMGPPYYVRMQENGKLGPCDAAEAEGVSVPSEDGTVLYALNGASIPIDPLCDDEGNIIEDNRTAPQGRVYQVPDGKFTIELLQDSKTHAGQIVDLEDGLVDQALTTDQRLADLEQALCELAIMQEEA